MRPDPADMSPSDLRLLREELGLSVRGLAAALGVTERAIHRWEIEAQQMRQAQADRFADLVEYTDRAVDELVAAHIVGQRLPVYPNNAAYQQAAKAEGHERVLTAQWHRAVVRRAAKQTGAHTDWARAD